VAKFLIGTLYSVALAALGTGTADAQLPVQTYDQIDLSASAEQDVANDLLIAIVYSEVQADRQSDAADRVNDNITWAARRADDARGVTTQTLQYTTRPVYANNSRIVGWQARQSLRLESRDSNRLSELLGTLQERVAIQSVNYAVSKQALDTAEDALIGEALARFESRAKLVAEQLGRTGYRIVRINIGTSGPQPMPAPFRTMRMDAAAAEIAPPTLDAGVQTVTVSVNGTIELSPAL